MDANAQVFRTEETARSRRSSDIAGAARALPATSRVQDKGKRFNTDLLEAVELGFLLDLAEVAGRRRAGPQGVAAAATSARTTRTATT